MVLQRKQKVFQNLWTKWNNLKPCRSWNFNFHQNKNHPSWTVSTNWLLCAQFWSRWKKTKWWRKTPTCLRRLSTHRRVTQTWVLKRKMSRWEIRKLYTIMPLDWVKFMKMWSKKLPVTNLPMCALRVNKPSATKVTWTHMSRGRTRSWESFGAQKFPVTQLSSEFPLNRST